MLYVSDPSNNVGLTNWASSGQCGQKMDECCNMADQGCCVNEGQKCYTVWEKQCRGSNAYLSIPRPDPYHIRCACTGVGWCVHMRAYDQAWVCEGRS